MKRLIICLVVAFTACASGVKGTPKFKAGDDVNIGVTSVPGQVLSADCSSSPCKYEVRYLSIVGDAREFKKEVFEEVELKLFVPPTPRTK